LLLFRKINILSNYTFQIYDKRVRGAEISQIFFWLLPMMMFNLLLIARHYGSCFQTSPPEHFYEVLEDDEDEAESMI
jgi:hypothetical protein